MELTCETIYKYLPKIIKGSTIDLSECKFFHPWALAFICLLLVEKHIYGNKKVILPQNPDLLSYLKRTHFAEILKELNYLTEASEISKISMPEKDNLNIEELTHCRFRDEFHGRLGRFIKIFHNFGLDENQARLVTALVGELGNNVFDHNALNWPTDITGCFIMAQNYPALHMIEFAISDPGVGFLGSLKNKFPFLEDDITAIKYGLEGNSGWFEGRRGNGLINIKNWTFQNFSGNICIHSGSGMVQVNEGGILGKNVYKIIGTIVQIMLYYK